MYFNGVSDEKIRQLLTKLEKQVNMMDLPVDSIRRLFPTTVENDNITSAFTTEMIFPVGTAEIIDEEASDYTTVSYDSSTMTYLVKELGAGFSISVRDLEIAAATSEGSLDNTLSSIARAKISQKEDELVIYGQPHLRNGIRGLYNHPNTCILLPQIGASGTTQWRTKTPQEVVKDVTDMISAIRGNSLGAEPDSLILPLNVFTYESGRQLSPSLATTVIQQIRNTFPQLVNIGYSRLLDTPPMNIANSLPAPLVGKPFAMMYKRSADVAAIRVIRDVKTYPEAVINMRMNVRMNERFGGIEVKQPAGIVIIPGI